MITDKPYQGVVSAPELSAQPGGSLTVRRSLISIPVEGGFARLPLGTPRSMVLALDWAVANTQKIWGSRSWSHRVLP